MRKIFLSSLLILSLAASSFAGLGSVKWPYQDGPGVEIADTAEEQKKPVIVSDGDGGAIIVWEDYRVSASTNPAGIFAQKVDSAGEIKWAVDEVGVSTIVAINIAAGIQAVPDGSGGVIIAWQDYRNGNYDIYAQKLNSSDGSRQWSYNGVPVSTATGSQSTPCIASDGSGGAVIAWQDNQSGTYRITAQRLNSSGSRVWTSTGVVTCYSGYDQDSPGMINDGSGNYIIVWHDWRPPDEGIYCQKLDTNGKIKWGVNGKAVCDCERIQCGPDIVSDDNGGAIVVWWDDRDRAVDNYDVYAQRIDSNGGAEWTANGVAVSSYCQISTSPPPDYVKPENLSIANDRNTSNGAFIAWIDKRGGTLDVYAQYIDGSGANQWTEGGVLVSPTTGDQRLPAIISDNAGGAIVTWWGSSTWGAYDICAQKIYNSQKMWQDENIAISTGICGGIPAAMVSDSYVGAIVAFQENKEPGNLNGIYAQKVTDADTKPPDPITTLSGITGPGPDEVVLTWTAPGGDGTVGTASTYMLRYATFSAYDTGWTPSTWWNAASVYAQDWSPLTSGSTEQQTIYLSGNTSYYFYMKAADAIPNYSDLSNITTAWAQVDDEPPSQITTIDAEPGDLEGKIDLTWSAPYDNAIAKTNRADRYEIRYTSVESKANNWDELIFWSTKQVSGFFGTGESLTLTGLFAGATYYMRIKAYDEVPLTSLVSYGATSWAQVDVTPPSDITCLKGVPGALEGRVDLTWSAPGDDGISGDLSGEKGRYEIRYTSVQSRINNWDSLISRGTMTIKGPFGTGENKTISGLTGGVTYWFRIKAFDDYNNWSISNSTKSVAQVDVCPPLAITTLTALTGSIEGDIRLSWIAPGDDPTQVGSTNDISEGRYGIKYSTDPAFDWGVASGFDVEWDTDTVYLANQFKTLPDLIRGATYYIRIWARDEMAVNWSEISTSATAWAMVDIEPPSAITCLSALTGTVEGTARLTWTAPYDNATSQTYTAARYEVRYSTAPDFDWESSTHSWISGVNPSFSPPKSPGGGESLTVDGLGSGVTYYFLIKTYDEIPLASLISNTATAWAQIDVPPARVTDLIASTTIAFQIGLTWTAPGDDADVGTATSYIIKYSSAASVGDLFGYATAWWDHAAVRMLFSPPTPKIAYSHETVTVTGLANETTYYFALRAIDDRGNESGISNFASAQTPDGIPPNAVTNLSGLSGSKEGCIDLDWTAPGDDGTQTGKDITGGKYRVRYSSYSASLVSGYYDIEWSTDTQYGKFQFRTVTGLVRGATYYLALQTRDDYVNWSGFSNIITALSAPDTVSPLAVPDLRAESPGPRRVDLYWTAPGDNGNEDDFGNDLTANNPGYEIRTSSSDLSLGTTVWWEGAFDILTAPYYLSGSTCPTTCGKSESLNITGLTDYVTWYFAIRTIDEANNCAEISTYPVFCIPPDSIPPEIAAFTQVETVNMAGNGILIEATATDNYAGITRMDLHYRIRNSTCYHTASMYGGSGDTGPVSVEGQIPGGYVTTRGVEYYIRALDKVNNEALSTGEKRTPWQAGFLSPPASPHMITVSTVTLTTIGKTGGIISVLDGNPADGMTSVTIENGTLDGDIVITISQAEFDADKTPVKNNPSLYDGDVPVAVYEFGPDGTVFKKPVTMRLLYLNNNPSDAYVDDTSPAAGEEDLRIFWWDGFAWRLVGGTVHTHTETDAGIRNTVEAKVFHFSKFALFEIKKSLALSDSRPKERIITPATVDGRNDFAEFSGLTGEYTIHIYDINGRLLATLNNADDGDSPAWRGTDEFGRPLKSGLYIYQIEKAGENVVSGVIVVAK